MKRAAATEGMLQQHPHGPWIVNGVRVGCSELQHRSCSMQEAAACKELQLLQYDSDS